MLLESSVLPEVVKDIIQELFINRFNSYYCGEEDYKQYNILLAYSLEIRQKGYVEFNN